MQANLDCPITTAVQTSGRLWLNCLNSLELLSSNISNTAFWVGKSIYLGEVENLELKLFDCGLKHYHTWEHTALVIDSIVKKIQNNIIVLKRELRWMYAFCCGLGSNVSTRLKQTSFIFGSSINLLYFNQVIRRAYTTRYFLSLEIVCKNHQTFLFYLKRIFYHQRLFARIITYWLLDWKGNGHI